MYPKILVRPELSLEWRQEYGRQIFGLKYEDNIEGIVCVAYTNDVPQSVRELELMSENAHMKDNADTAVAYTVWSRKRGAGREIIHKLLEHVKANESIQKVVTLSPLTPMATHFHIRNGAKLVQHNPDTQNLNINYSLILLSKDAIIPVMDLTCPTTPARM